MNNYIYEFKDLPSTDTPFNAETFTAMQNKLLDSIYPIGRGFIDFTNTDYSNYLGFTWERELVGLTPIGLDATQEEFDTIGKIGGEKTHTLTVDELANHNHNPEYGTKFLVNTYPFQSQVAYSENTSATKYFDYDNCNTTSSVGGNQPHNNLPPYKVVAYWKRVA